MENESQFKNLGSRMPNLFPYFYLGMMCLLMTYRYIDYSAIKSELYMLDFCYFVNLSVILQVFLAPDDLTWFKANYVLCMGPICIGNSSLQKLKQSQESRFCSHHCLEKLAGVSQRRQADFVLSPCLSNDGLSCLQVKIKSKIVMLIRSKHEYFADGS